MRMLLLFSVVLEISNVFGAAYKHSCIHLQALVNCKSWVASWEVKDDGSDMELE